jgi:nucleoside phosphorylase
MGLTGAGMALTTTDWLQLNLGIKPDQQAPIATFALGKRPQKDEDFQREIIDFDSEAPEGSEFFAFAAGATGLSKFQDIAWPKGREPRPVSKIAGRSNGPLPKGDILLVTWTVDEGHALSRVLTPGFDSKNDWKSYTHNMKRLFKKFRAACPARNAGRLGAYWVTKINGLTVVCFKSESHLSQDGPQIPNFDVWQQLIDEVRPTLIITTGTGGGIGKRWEVGDVIVSPIVRFDCKKKFKNTKFQGQAFAKASYKAPKKVRQGNFAKARELFRANATHLPNTNSRKIPTIAVSNSVPTSIVTTDFFGFDNSQNTYKLQGLGDLSEMGDAVLGAVLKPLAHKAPAWVAVRNVSDPQINEPGKSLREQAHDAALIYKGFGRWSSVCSAIVCWALITAEG